MARHRARERALQLLFQWDMRRTALDEISRGYYESLLVDEESLTHPQPDEFSGQLVEGVVAEINAVDDLIERHAEHWRIVRMPAVDRNILRIAAYEMKRTDTPPAVVIDEALELARRFAGEESVHFVNGVLDAIRRELAAPAGVAPA
jgi:N utilization substance protein B